MRRTIYAILAIASVMALTLAGTAQAEEVCFYNGTMESVGVAFEGSSVSSPEPGLLRIDRGSWRHEEGAPAYPTETFFLHEGMSVYPKWPIIEVPNTTRFVDLKVSPGLWSVTAYARFVVGGFACHSLMQLVGAATVAALPLRGAVHAGVKR